jgi:hypothetical protein
LFDDGVFGRRHAARSVARFALVHGANAADAAEIFSCRVALGVFAVRNVGLQ